MLKKILKTASFFVPLMLSACGDSSSPLSTIPMKDTIVQRDSLVYDTVVINGETVVKVDTIVKNDTITTIAEEKVPYYVENEKFSWDDLQDVSTPVLDVNGVIIASCSSSKKGSSSSSSAQSSDPIGLISSSSETPSTVNDGVLTDGRDGQAYKVENVGGVLWMAENIKFVTKTGTLCKNSGEDLCVKFGMFYSKTAMKSACPKGWHLPSEAEVSAADAIVDHEWWVIAGRFKSDGSYGNEKQGYIWLANGSTFLVENYSENDREHKVVSDTDGRYYNVRCVQD